MHIFLEKTDIKHSIANYLIKNLQLEFNENVVQLIYLYLFHLKVSLFMPIEDHYI